MLIDTHCHVLSSEYDNPKKVIEESISSGVDKMIINGFDVQSSFEAYDLANKYKEVYCATGIGPENIDSYDENSVSKFKELIKKNKKIVAIGEIGLDYYWTKENKEEQIKVFRRMLSLAEECDLPVIVHMRDSFLDTYNILKEYNITGIIHCFSGSVEVANKFIELGFLLGIGGVVTFKNSKKLKEVVKAVNIKYLSLETDSPYLSPEPYRGKTNYPLYVKEVANKIAELKGISYVDVLSITSSNVLSKFDLI